MKPAKPRNTSALEQLKLRLRQFLHRELTPREECLLELSEPILEGKTEENSEAA
jgi:hypothetical protein